MKTYRLLQTAVPPPSVAAPHVMGNGGSSVSVTTPVALTLTVPSVPPPHISMTVAPPPIAGSLPDLSVPPPNFSLPPPAVPPPQQANPKAPYQVLIISLKIKTFYQVNMQPIQFIIAQIQPRGGIKRDENNWSLGRKKRCMLRRQCLLPSRGLRPSQA